jgi:hypothetical protein
MRADRHTADACYCGYHRDVRAAKRSLIMWSGMRTGTMAIETFAAMACVGCRRGQISIACVLCRGLSWAAAEECVVLRARVRVERGLARVRALDNGRLVGFERNEMSVL